MTPPYSSTIEQNDKLKFEIPKENIYVRETLEPR